jgi:hypothetical protein
MIDLVLLVVVLAAATAGGLAVLAALRAAPDDPVDRLISAAAAGLGLAGAVGLGLAAAGELRLLPLLAIGGLALLGGGPALLRTVAAIGWRAIGRAWPLLVPAAAFLAVELCAMLAPPIGGDQTKYHLVYPRLYADAGALVDTPWTFWGQMQYLHNFLFAIGFTLRGDVLVRLLHGAIGVLTAAAIGRLVRRQLGAPVGVAAAVLFFTLPMTWSMMTRVGCDMAVALYAVLAVGALIDWTERGEGGALRAAAFHAGLAGGSKVMGLLVPALVGGAMLVVLFGRGFAVRRMLAPVATFGLIAALAASPCYVRNAVDTGNPIYPFGYGVFGGEHWSAAASSYLDDYYHQYQTRHASRREGTPYHGVDVVRFPWDLTMHPGSFENSWRQSLDIGPFALAFTPALLLLRRRRDAALLTAGLGLAYLGIIAAGAWAHPRYVFPGVVLVFAAAIPAAWSLLGPRVFTALVVVSIAGNAALTRGLLNPMWKDQARVALGRLAPDEFLRRHSDRFAFWERANAAMPAAGRVMVLEKIPHPYYIERQYVLASYLEQGLIDYRHVAEPAALGHVARDLGVTHVAVDLAALDAAGDPYEASVARLWRAFVGAEADLVFRANGYALYGLRPTTAFAAAGQDG